MRYRKITFLSAFLVVSEVCSVMATSLVSSSEASVTQTSSIGAGFGGTSCGCGPIVIPAVIKPILQSEYSPALTPCYTPSVTPSVPCFNNFNNYPYPPCYPPVFIDGGENQNTNFNRLLYFLIFALNRRGGYGGGYNGGYSGGGGYNSGCGGGCGCNGGCSGCCGYNSGYGYGSGCNSVCGCNNGYCSGCCGYSNGCGTCLTTDTTCNPTVVDASNGEDIIITQSCCQSGCCSENPLRVIIRTASESN